MLVAAHRVVMVMFRACLRLPQFTQVPSPLPSNVEGFCNIILVNFIFFSFFYLLPLFLHYQNSVNNLEDFFLDVVEGLGINLEGKFFILPYTVLNLRGSSPLVQED